MTWYTYLRYADYSHDNFLKYHKKFKCGYQDYDSYAVSRVQCMDSFWGAVKNKSLLSNLRGEDVELNVEYFFNLVPDWYQAVIDELNDILTDVAKISVYNEIEGKYRIQRNYEAAKYYIGKVPIFKVNIKLDHKKYPIIHTALFYFIHTILRPLNVAFLSERGRMPNNKILDNKTFFGFESYLEYLCAINTPMMGDNYNIYFKYLMERDIIRMGNIKILKKMNSILFNLQIFCPRQTTLITMARDVEKENYMDDAINDLEKLKKLNTYKCRYIAPIFQQNPLNNALNSRNGVLFSYKEKGISELYKQYISYNATSDLIFKEKKNG